MQILGKILGSEARVKIMRLFLLNRTKGFKGKDVAKRSRVTPAAVRRELKLLRSINFVKKKGEDWSFNPDFKYSGEMEDLLINTESLDNEAILRHFKNAGKTKLLLVSGVFIKNKDSRVDLLIVGDKMKRGRIEERSEERRVGEECR